MLAKKYKLLVIFFLFTFLVVNSVFLISCRFGDLGLNLGLDNEDENKVEDNKKTLDINGEELFLKLKSKQKDKNPLSDINVRKAIFYAINRERIVDELLEDYGNVLNSLFSRNSIYYYPAWEEYSYDVDKAKEYLGRADYSTDNPLYITIGACEDSSSKQIIEDLIKEDLEKIGINVWIFNKPSKEWYIDFVNKGNYELGIWSLYTLNGENLENYFHSQKIPPMQTGENKNCNNFYWYSNKEVDEILRKISNENDTADKKSLLIDLQKIIADDAVILPLYSRVFSVAYNAKIKNVDIDLRDGNFLANIDKWDIDSKENRGVEENKEIVVGCEEEPYVLNPFITDSLFTEYINSLIVRGLWELNGDGEYIPVLVEESPDTGEEEMIRYTLKANVKLKDNIFWQDGTPITSEDVKYTFKSIIEDDTLLEDFGEYEKLEDIEIIDEKEFNIIFKEYFKDWKKLFFVIFPKSKLEGKKLGYLFKNDIFGCGPYKLKEWIRGENLLLEKNEFYSGIKPNIDSIKFLFNSDKNYLISMLKDGKVDIISIPADLELMNELKENKNINLLVKQGNLWEHLAICLKPKEE